MKFLAKNRQACLPHTHTRSTACCKKREREREGWGEGEREKDKNTNAGSLRRTLVLTSLRGTNIHGDEPPNVECRAPDQSYNAL